MGICLMMLIVIVISLGCNPRAYKLYYFLILLYQAAFFTAPRDYGTFWNGLILQEQWVLYTMFCAGNFWTEWLITVLQLAYLNFFVRTYIYEFTF